MDAFTQTRELINQSQAPTCIQRVRLCFSVYFGTFNCMQEHITTFPMKYEAARLRLVELLGTGSTSTVFRAERSPQAAVLTSPSRGPVAGNSMVAVKVPGSGISLEREAATLKQFVHPNIIDLVEDKTHDDGSLVLEWCAGGTVEDLLHDRAVSGVEVRDLVCAISSALTHIHDAGWIHGDVNPSNIGLRANGQPVLIDFGTCRPADGKPPASGTEEFSGTEIASTPTFDVLSLIHI